MNVPTQETERLWGEFADQLGGFLRSRIADPAVAEDLRQDVFLKLQQRIRTDDSIRDHRAWLYRLARKSVPDKADNPLFAFRMDTLFDRSGLSGRQRWFRGKLEDIAARQPLPEYDVVITRDKRHELVTLVKNRAKPPRLPRGVPRLVIGND